MNGKGDKPRPVDKKIFDANHDAIRWKSKSPGNKPVVQPSKGNITPSSPVKNS